MEAKGYRPLMLQMQLKIIKTENQLQSHVDSKASVTKKTVNHSLFIKKNKSKDPELPNEKTLFVTNLPLDCTEGMLKSLFRSHGEIVNVKWPETRITGGSCHLVFKDTESIDIIMDIESLPYPQYNVDFLNLVKRPDTSLLKQKVDEAMVLFDNQQEEEEEDLVDEDGFTLVRKGKKKLAGSVYSITKDEAENLKPKSKELSDFYRFQKREKKQQGNNF